MDDIRGRDGIDGKDGLPGKDGKDGLPGADGENGKDGYTPVKGVDYFDGLPGKDGAKGDPGEIPDVSSFARKSDIPSTLPNPQKLTFSGAVSAEYDGSSAVEVQIPQGGGGGKYELIYDYTIPDDADEVSKILVDKDMDGKPFSLSEFIAVIKFRSKYTGSSTLAQYGMIRGFSGTININKGNSTMFVANNEYARMYGCVFKDIGAFQEAFDFSNTNDSSNANNYIIDPNGNMSPKIWIPIADGFSGYTGIEFNYNFMYPGNRILIWGVRK